MVKREGLGPWDLQCGMLSVCLLRWLCAGAVVGEVWHTELTLPYQTWWLEMHTSPWPLHEGATVLGQAIEVLMAGQVQ